MSVEVKGDSIIIYLATWINQGDYMDLEYMTLHELRKDIEETESLHDVELLSIQKLKI